MSSFVKDGHKGYPEKSVRAETKSATPATRAYCTVPESRSGARTGKGLARADQPEVVSRTGLRVVAVPASSLGVGGDVRRPELGSQPRVLGTPPRRGIVAVPVAERAPRP